MLAARRILTLAGSTAVLGGLIVAAVRTALPAVLVATPIVGALWLLVLVDCGYRVGRERAHRRRRTRRGQHAAWTPDPHVRTPITYPGILRRPPGGDPVDRQGDFRAFGIRLAVLPALAVLFLTVQILFLRDSEALAVGFVLAECLLLAVMVWTVWKGQDPSRPWVVNRVRGELFRREMYLLLVGVGPYLGLGAQNAQQVRDARLDLLSTAGLPQLDDLGRFTERTAQGAERHWQDEVWRRGTQQLSDPTDATERMRTYLDYRIQRQALFMELAGEKCERTEESLGRVAKGMVILGIAIALPYAGLLLLGRGGDGPSTAASIVALLAACAPPLCGAVSAVQNLFAAQRLALSYQETRQELRGHENTLRTLLAQPLTPDAFLSFQALAVRVESTLAEELRRWRIIVARPEFDAGL
ncbi:hypothetical protein [Streptomyces albipurpureus]|uniref:Integral membrane protein n=1 Tax=Streptomyces albipurpureus TaxID=2897419 RepID=A0ABT0UVD5_9ACTN|nr:hypothetical protein [Streptomyces sp. CWNU-1]MCM2392547.1 hypothetical protein [Streptomyces sp. CWNU-1]